MIADATQNVEFDLSVADNRIQKTWIAEGTEEYLQFKSITKENAFLASFTRERFKLASGDLVLDVGGRDGQIALALQNPRDVHIVDPDPFIEPDQKVGRFFRRRIQDVSLSPQSYKLIICSHVLGYLSRSNVQKQIITKLLEALKVSGTAILFYNKNSEYMQTLLEFSKSIVPNGHYDFFDERILYSLDRKEFDIECFDVDFVVEYGSFEELGRCCWFLFGDLGNNITETAEKFLPRLRSDLPTPGFSLTQRIIAITRTASNRTEGFPDQR